VALVLSVVVSMPDVLAAESGVDEIPEPYDGSTVRWQALAGAGTMLVMTAGGVAMLTRGMYGGPIDRDPAVDARWNFGGAGMLLVIPFVTPIPVNLIGNARGYEDQYMGAHLGAITVSMIGVGVSLGLGVIDSHRGSQYAAFAALSYFGGTFAGSVLGYHVQASMRQSDDADSDEAQPMSGPALTPTVEPDGDWGVSAGW